MHDLTDDDRARLEEIARTLESMEGGTAVFSPTFRRDADFLRELAQQTSEDQGLRITDEMVERAAKAVTGGRVFQGDRWLVRTALEAALTDSTDDKQEDR